MNKKYLLIVICLTFLFTGCTANYKLNYVDGKFTENLELIGDGMLGSDFPTYEEARKDGVIATKNSKEKFTLSEDSNEKQAFLTHKLKNVKLEDLRVASSCFSLSSYDETDDYYYLSLFGTYYCQDRIDEGTFELVTDSKVLLQNADKQERKGNKMVYTWDLMSDKIAKDGITFEVSKNIKNTSVENVTGSNSTMTTIKIVIGVVFIIIAIGTVLYLRKRAEE